MIEKLYGVRVRTAIPIFVLLNIAVWCLSSPSGNLQAQSLLDDKSAVRAVVEGIVAADNVEALERVLGYYASDAILIAPEGPDVIGTNALRRHYQSLFAAVDFDIHSRIDEISIAEDLAVVRGLNTVSAVAANSSQENCTASKYLMTLTRTDSEWKISRLMWTNQAIEC